MKKWNKKALAGVGLGALALVGGTFAYYNQTVSLDNPLGTGKYENELVEDYTPPTEDVKPGATIDKKVGAKNTGDYPVMVRIRMDEKWTKGINPDENGVPQGTEDIITQTSNELTKFNIDDTKFKTGNNGQKLWLATQQDGDDADSDGVTVGDYTVVRKNLGDKNKWIYNSADGFWYYYKVLGKEDATENLLESISIASNIDLGHYIQEDYYYVGDENTEKESILDSDWIKYKVTREKGTDGKEKVTAVALYEADGKTTTAVGDQNKDGEINAIDLALWLKNQGEMTEGKKLFRRNESLLDENATGYADANYTLVVTSQFVQATPDALREAWPNMPQEIEKVVDAIDVNTVGNPNP
ncbi:MAG: hypothetical protein HFG57_04135 [Lachnospiraceae bacterium]|nr:hypothetical protein [Lachnospiraceae bacterium]